ncbi:hypothetical protein BGZ65_005077, partial [Modicella reniformis]
MSTHLIEPIERQVKSPDVVSVHPALALELKADATAARWFRQFAVETIRYKEEMSTCYLSDI